MKKTCLAAIIYVLLCNGAALAHTHHTHHSGRHVAIHTVTIPNVGFATWYDYKKKDGFHITANGERFNPHTMTCAHRTMPFNTLVKVVDLKTGKYIECRINDRMGAQPPRIIDLTMGAAQSLGIQKEGKVRVRLEPIEVAAAPK